MPIYKTSDVIVDCECEKCGHFWRTEMDINLVDTSQNAKIPVTYQCPECKEFLQSVVKGWV